MEIWKDIKGYEGYYQVSTHGKVRSLIDNNGKPRIKVIKPYYTRGYLRAVLVVNRDRKTFLVHRLVLETFGKPNPNLQVNHINGIKDDNRLANLEWCTQSENMKHAYRFGLQKPVDNGLQKEICMMKDNQEVKCFESIREMCRQMNFDRRLVQRTLNGDNKYHKGYTFKIRE